MCYNVGIVSLGCDKNRVDTEVILSFLLKYGYNIVNKERDADAIIINTCAFIESAKMESIETILEMARHKQYDSCKCLIVVGCLSQRYKEELIKNMPEIDAVVGPQYYSELPQIIEDIIKNKEKHILKVNNRNYDIEYGDRVLTTPNHYAYVKISEGCNNNCSYCAIPKIKGKYRSRTIENIKKEIIGLTEKGVKEIIIVAQDTTMYGIDIYGKKALVDLLDQIQNVPGLKWIKVLYMYPEQITDELIELIKNSNKICHYFDIPLQHVSNEVLKRMRRRNTKEYTIELINKIRKEIPDAIIRTTFIVGFPGETDKEFSELKEFVEDMKLDRVGVFTYSQEEGTEASLMENQIEEEVKENRKEIIMEAMQKISTEKNNKLIGKVIDVIVDKEIHNGTYIGRTYGDAPDIDQNVTIKANDHKINTGDIVKVKITKTFIYDLMGDVIYEYGK